MNEQEFSELAAGHALGALEPDDARAFAAAREAHPEWETLVEREVATAALMAQATPAVAPPAALKAELFARLDAGSGRGSAESPEAADRVGAERTPDDGERPPAHAAARRGGMRGWFALAASVVFIAALAVGVFAVREWTRPEAEVALEQIDAATDGRTATVDLSGGGAATLHWSDSIGKAVLVADGLPEIAEEESYELWFVRDETPIAAGTFEPADDTARALLDGPVREGDVVAVTVEQQGGSPTGSPTSDPLLAIPTT